MKDFSSNLKICIIAIIPSVLLVFFLNAFLFGEMDTSFLTQISITIGIVNLLFNVVILTYLMSKK